MRLLDRLADRYSLRQGFWEGMASGAAVYMGSYGDPGHEKALANLVGQARDAYQSNGAVFAVSLIRLALFSDARFVFQSLVDKHTYGSQDLAILEEPWPNCTTGELLARMEQDLTVAGNAYLWKAEDDLLVQMPPDEVTIISEEFRGSRGHYRRVVGYDWDPSPVQNVAPGTDNRSEQAQTLPVEEVAHWSPIADPRAKFRGMSWLTPIMREISADTAMTSYKIAYLENMAAPNLLRLGGARAAVSYEQAMRRLGDVTLRHLWRTASAALQKLVPGVPPAGVRLWYDTSDIAALRASETERGQTSQVQAAALLTIVQAGYTRESAKAFLASGDVNQLEPEPLAPPPGISGRETTSEKVNAPPAAAKPITDGNPGGEPPRPSQKVGPPSGNGKGPTPKQMRPMPPALLRRP